MDENWGNILYLILMALFVIAGALRKKKKPAEQYENIETPRAEHEMPAGIENIFDTILGANSIVPEQDHPYEAHKAEEIHEVEEEVEITSLYEDSIESIEYDDPKPMIVESLEEEEEVEVENQEFDWKRAIISKEILDRKYI